MGAEPVIVLQGPRSVGKSTLLTALAEGERRRVLDLDDLATRDAVRADPAFSVASEGPVFIDEFQHVPEILDAIKAELNRDASPGRFILTGSTSYGSLPLAARSLTGRAHIMTVLPLSQGEIAEVRESFAQVLIEDPSQLVPHVGQTQRAGYARRVLTGGFPLALRRHQPAERARWFDDYVQMIIERDVLELSKVRQRDQLPLLLRRLASQTGSVLNMAAAASAIRMESSTAENYTKLLEAVFLLRRLPAWGTTLGSRVATAPKIHLVDSGLAGRLMRVTAEKLTPTNPQALAEFGHLLETFAVGEIVKQLAWVDEPTSVGHWRTHNDAEVDLVIERGDGLVVGVEVKAGSRVPGGSVKGLQLLSDRLGSRFLGGVVLYTGARAYTYAPSIFVLPLDRLWAPAASP